MNEYGSLLKWHWHWKTAVSTEKSVTMSLCPSQIRHGLTLDRTWVSIVRIWQLTAWATTHPPLKLFGLWWLWWRRPYFSDITFFLFSLQGHFETVIYSYVTVFRRFWFHFLPAQVHYWKPFTTKWFTVIWSHSVCVCVCLCVCIFWGVLLCWL
jgi:hypothetical protein